MLQQKRLSLVGRQSAQRTLDVPTDVEVNLFLRTRSYCAFNGHGR